MEKDRLLQAIESSLRENITDSVHYSAIGNTKPSKGEIVLAYVFANREYNFDNQLARVVQIRLGCGQFASDMYFLRLPTGQLITAENQSYRKIPSEFLDQVESHFSTNIEYENDGFEEGFTIGGEQLEVGFIVDGKRTQGTPDESFSITIKG
jgi:hypothetical protein